MSSEQQEREPIPWKWLGMGLFLTVLGCIIAVLFLRTFLVQTQPPPADPPQATIIILTAPPSPTIDLAGSALPPTPIPTFTPIPTPDAAVAPSEITSGFYAMVANTDGLGVTIRGGPSTRNVALMVAEEGTIMLILDGPEEGDSFSWWQVQLQDGTEGWAATDFLEPAAAP
jgi:hypothetical protein